jgi:hypothetical protein
MDKYQQSLNNKLLQPQHNDPTVACARPAKRFVHSAGLTTRTATGRGKRNRRTSQKISTARRAAELPTTHPLGRYNCRVNSCMNIWMKSLA